MADSSASFDASVGLAFSLKAFEVYRKSGMLSAEVRSMPGIRGKCMACLEVVQGKVVAGYVIDRTGTRHATNQQLLVQLDTEKGPFSWIFHAGPTPGVDSTLPEQSQQTFIPEQMHSPIPQQQVRYLDQQQMQQWTTQQQHSMHTIFSMINGQRSINDIKQQTSLPATTVDEVIRILLFLRAIALKKS